MRPISILLFTRGTTFVFGKCIKALTMLQRDFDLLPIILITLFNYLNKENETENLK